MLHHRIALSLSYCSALPLHRDTTRRENGVKDNSIEGLLVVTSCVTGYLCLCSGAVHYIGTESRREIFSHDGHLFLGDITRLLLLVNMYDTGMYAFSGPGPTKFFLAGLGLSLGEQVVEDYHETHCDQ